MNVTEAVLNRRSIRAFKDEPVDPAVLRRVFEAAQMSPSGCNFQPWEGVVLTGEPVRELSSRIKGAVPQDPQEYQLIPKDIPARYTQRLQEITAARFDAIGLARDDAEGRGRVQARNFEFFGAPALLLCFVPRIMGPPQWSDVGMWLQTVMLLLEDEGLGSCPQEPLYVHGRLIKDFVGVSDETHLFFCGMAIGHPDMDDPMNRFERTRAPLDEVVRFVGDT